MGPLKHPLTHISLCFNSREFRIALRDLKLHRKYKDDFLPVNKDAAVHYFNKTDNSAISCIVCIRPLPPSDSESIRIRLPALLAHEATHIWQYICDHMGELEPGREVTAYCIQSLTADLLDLYEERHDTDTENTGSE